jgi:7,8-dihydroneopterin aldolase/epimerase/oxygenase
MGRQENLIRSYPTTLPPSYPYSLFPIPYSLTLMDIIQLTGIRCYGYTGYLPEEQFLGQWFEVDLRISVDLKTAGHTDRIEDTLDYRGIIATVKKIISTAKFALVEKLADTIITTVLAENRVHQVELKLHKLAAPIPDFGGRITIELTRTKSQSDILTALPSLPTF